jgi:hypothetical protein
VSSAFKEDDWDEFGLNGKYFASIRELGDNFAISATVDNEENVDFYLLVCTRKMYTYTKAFRCKWGESLEVGDEIIEGRYYQKYGISSDTYVYLRKSHKARDVIKDDFGRKLPSGRPFRPDVRARPRLPRGRSFTRGQVFTVCRHGKNRVRADTKKIKNKIKMSARTLGCVHADVKKNNK